MSIIYPFSGITGQENAKKALQCALVNDEIRTILVMGDRGTAKSTLVRSVETIAGGRRVLTVPQNITYDRLLGTIDIENAVSYGNVHITPGLLEQGKGQILYADDVNLMDEGIVRNILNASETGHYILEREGLSHLAGTRFTFLATMDPVEADLSLALMDRFDLCICLDPIEDPTMRAGIVRKQLRFERGAEEFIRECSGETGSIRKTIEAARERLPYVSIPEGHAELISSLCLELGVKGQRGDIALARAATTLAALDGRDTVVFDDVKLAALFALEHRRSDVPPPPPPPEGLPPEAEQHRDQDAEDGSGQARQGCPPASVPESAPPAEGRERNERPDLCPPPPAEQVFAIGPAFEVIRYLDEQSRQATRKQKSGRRTRVTSTDSSGHYHSSRLPWKNKSDIALDATLRAAAPYQVSRNRHDLAIAVERADLREKVREKKVAHTILFLVDASGSMGVRRRMVAVKGAVLSLLNDAYQKRDRIGLMIFRGKGTRLLLPPTKSPELAVKMLREIPTGGTTPLVRGIAEAYALLTRGKYAAPGENRSIVLLTDGRANVTMGKKPPYEELADMARKIAGKGVRFVVVDTELGFPRLGRARILAGDLEASYLKLENLSSRRLAVSVAELIYTAG